VDIHEIITAASPPCIAETNTTLVMKSDGTIAFSVFYSDVYVPTAMLPRDILRDVNDRASTSWCLEDRSWLPSTIALM
jgi:hypothetical protein